MHTLRLANLSANIKLSGSTYCLNEPLPLTSHILLLLSCRLIIRRDNNKNSTLFSTIHQEIYHAISIANSCSVSTIHL